MKRDDHTMLSVSIGLRTIHVGNFFCLEYKPTYYPAINSTSEITRVPCYMACSQGTCEEI